MDRPPPSRLQPLPWLLIVSVVAPAALFGLGAWFDRDRLYREGRDAGASHRLDPAAARPEGPEGSRAGPDDGGAARAGLGLA
ncbi:MAG: hypothetical protein WDO24_23060 [Pseudomonadota bacterium]